jgi:hypothetical protein
LTTRTPILLESFALQQNDRDLSRDDTFETRWRLESLSESVVIHESDGDNTVTIKPTDDKYLLFKLGGQNEDEGRRVLQPSHGSYIVVVPEDWKWDESVSGPPPVASEQCVLDGYRVHFANISPGANTRITLISPDGPVVIGAEKAQFELVGNRINDASENRGPLFGGDRPKLSAADPSIWSTVGRIVVGEEGPGRNKWRSQIAVNCAATEQNLPDELIRRGPGWYFARIYNYASELITSLDFRFVPTLTEVRIKAVPLPEADGHRSATVEFIHKPGTRVRPATETEGTTVEETEEKTIVKLPPNRAADLTYWKIGTDRRQVDFELLLDRIWWSYSGADSPAEQVNSIDRPFQVTPDAFLATSKETLCVWFPKPGWIRDIHLGFSLSGRKRIQVSAGKRQVVVPFRDLGDLAGLNSPTETQLTLWLDSREGSPAVFM